LDAAIGSVYVYVLKSDEHWRFYVGLAKDVEVRLREHNVGKTKSTRPYIPWSLVLWYECDSFAEARILEKWFKSGVGKEYIKRHWQNNFERKKG
jgi:putative endonuclease